MKPVDGARRRRLYGLVGWKFGEYGGMLGFGIEHQNLRSLLKGRWSRPGDLGEEGIVDL